MSLTRAFVILNFLVSVLYCGYADEQPRIRVLVPIEKSTYFDTALKEIVSDFNAKGGTRVELQQKGEFFESLREIISSHYAGELPDLALVQISDLKTLSPLKVLQGFPSAWFKERGFLQNLQVSAECAQPPCSIPFQRHVPLWFFNQEILFRLNQNTNAIPAQWNALAKFSMTLRKPNEFRGLSIAASGQSALSRWSALGLHFSQNPVDDTVNWVHAMTKTSPDILPGLMHEDEALRQFLDQKSVIFLGGLEQWRFIRKNSKFKWAATLPIQSGGGVNNFFSGTDFVLLQKKNRDASLKFLEFLYRPENLTRLQQDCPSLPLRQRDLQSPAFTKSLAEIEPLRTLVAAPHFAKLKPVQTSKIPPQVREEWASKTWATVESHHQASPSAEEEASRLRFLRANLQKLLSSQAQ